MAQPRYRLEPLADRHDRRGFSCGVQALDRYFHEQAGQDSRRGLAVPCVLVEADSGALVGYYTLSAFSMVPASLPAERIRRLPAYPSIPAILIGRLAVDSRYQGQGLGKRLLMDAIHRSLDISRQIGVWAVVVDAKDDAARSFYEGYGFVQFADHEYRLFLPMATIAQAFPR